LGEVLVSLEEGPAKLRVIGCHFLSSPLTTAEAPATVEAIGPTTELNKAPTVANTAATRIMAVCFRLTKTPLFLTKTPPSRMLELISLVHILQ
jgi:hypothetical protein